MYQKQFLDLIASNFLSLAPVIDPNISKSDYIPLDLSVSNYQLKMADTTSSVALGKYIFDFITMKGARVAYGGYMEKRSIYNRSAYFNHEENNSRCIHLGLDLWVEAGTRIYAPVNAIVHSFKNNTNYGDYGPTIILEHEINNLVFYTLYGHLSLESISSVKHGEAILQGKPFATLGEPNINGDYPPHLHFQIILDLQGNLGDYPGVSNETDLDYYLENCPDPNLMLGL